jgi:hypothetical protein
MRSSNSVNVNPLFIVIAAFRYRPDKLNPNVSSSPQLSGIDQFVIPVRLPKHCLRPRSRHNYATAESRRSAAQPSGILGLIVSMGESCAAI